MSQPEGAAAPHGRPLRVISERLTAEEAERTRATPSVTRFASHQAATDRAAADRASAAPTAVLPVLGGAASAPAPVPATALPVLAARRPRRRVAELVRLVFSRRRAGRHRPDTTPLQCWSMVAPQRRRQPRWGRR